MAGISSQCLAVLKKEKSKSTSNLPTFDNSAVYTAQQQQMVREKLLSIPSIKIPNDDAGSTSTSGISSNQQNHLHIPTIITTSASHPNSPLSSPILPRVSRFFNASSSGIDCIDGRKRSMSFSNFSNFYDWDEMWKTFYISFWPGKWSS